MDRLAEKLGVLVDADWKLWLLVAAIAAGIWVGAYLWSKRDKDAE